ncbi:hypothetical protein [Sorangium atrum]|uniref:Uncharacterized protein n=1 Tax=Sorangium atrum TaxID=2995308 RepID=A0ABT5C1S1_9BACT|nr:hypothetical protein [Sorangium aterium]MDC0679709.1 hypothetical protein [Sorangium aterium]
MSFATPDDYYDHTPEPGHSTGDIWCGLPSYGVLKQEHIAGIVITPACDLQNSKSKTITYLPLLAFDAWLATSSMLTEVRGTTQSCWNSFQEQLGSKSSISLPRVPALSDLSALQAHVEPLADGGKGQLKAKILAGIKALIAIIDPVALTNDLRSITTLFGERDFNQKCQKLVTNSLRSDTHFLPARGGWATLDDSFASHALVMFRYPLTVPLDILELASSPKSNWSSALAEYAALPATRFFAKRQPLRVARLRPRFFADLLSRYTALYARVGSPDFSPAVASVLASQISGHEARS